MAVCGDMLSGRSLVGVIGRWGRADLLVDEGVEADVRAPTEAALAHWAVVLPQEIIDLPYNRDKKRMLASVENVNKFSETIISHFTFSWEHIINNKIMRGDVIPKHY